MTDQLARHHAYWHAYGAAQRLIDLMAAPGDGSMPVPRTVTMLATIAVLIDCLDGVSLASEARAELASAAASLYVGLARKLPEEARGAIDHASAVELGAP